MVQEEGQQGGEDADRQNDYRPRISLSRDTKRATIGGGVAALVALIGLILVNVSSGGEARLLLEGMLPSIRFLCSAVMTATATVLALMLTLLSFSNTQSARLKSAHYDRVRQIAQMDSVTFAAALVLLLLVSVPLAESSEVPASWYTIVYYVTVLYTAGLGGALIVIVLMLYHAVTDLIGVIHPTEKSHLLADDD